MFTGENINETPDTRNGAMGLTYKGFTYDGE